MHNIFSMVLKYIMKTSPKIGKAVFSAGSPKNNYDDLDDTLFVAGLI